MVANGGSPDHSLSLRLERGFGEFNFLQMIRLWLREQDGRAGVSGPAVRFVADLDAGFPARAASAVRVETIASASPAVSALSAGAVQGERARMLAITTPDFCVGSALGPLPEPFLEWMRELDRAGQPAMRAFLDLFNNRLNLLRYETRAGFEPGLNNERPERSEIAAYLGALMGVGSAGQAAQIPMPKRQWLGIGDLLANGRRSAAGLVQVVSAQLGFAVRLQPLTGAWRAIDPDDRHRLGSSGHRLGVDTLLGRSNWDPQSRIRLSAGPVRYDQLIALLPPLNKAEAPKSTLRELQREHRQAALTGMAPPAHTSYEELQGLLRLMLDRRQDVEMVLRLPDAEVPLASLGAAGGMRLGLTSWLKSRATQAATDARPAPLKVARFLVPAYDSGVMT